MKIPHGKGWGVFNIQTNACLDGLGFGPDFLEGEIQRDDVADIYHTDEHAMLAVATQHNKMRAMLRKLNRYAMIRETFPELGGLLKEVK